MTRIRRLISSVTGRFLPGTAEDYRPGQTVQVTQRRGSYLTAGDRQRLSSALAVTYRYRTDDEEGILNAPVANLTPLERAALDLLTKTE